MTHARLGALVLLSLVTAGAAAGCAKKKPKPEGPPPEVTGLAAVPATAQVVIAADVQKLAGSELVTRAAEQLILRDQTIAQRWAELQEHCKLELTDKVKRVMLAVGPTPQGGSPGTGPVLMVATGALSEPDLVACMPKVVGGGNGALTSRSTGGRTLYQVKDGNRQFYFAFGRPDTIVLGTNDAWVLEALSTNPKAPDNPELAGWIRLTKQTAPIWFAGRLDPRVGQGLIAASNGKLTEPIDAVVGWVDPTDGAKLELGALMKSPEAAKALESLANAERGLAAAIAQKSSLGPAIAKVKIATEGNLVRITAGLTQGEVNQLLSVLDEKPAPEQGTQPPQ